jgi:hypothetical protein
VVATAPDRGVADNKTPGNGVVQVYPSNQNCSVRVQLQQGIDTLKVSANIFVNRGALITFTEQTGNGNNVFTIASNLNLVVGCATLSLNDAVAVLQGPVTAATGPDFGPFPFPLHDLVQIVVGVQGGKPFADVYDLTSGASRHLTNPTGTVQILSRS